MLKKIGGVIRGLRKSKKWTQEEFAQKMGSDQAYISKVENGVLIPSLDTLGKMAGEFGLPLEAILLLAMDKPSLPEEQRKTFESIQNEMMKSISQELKSLS